MVELLSRSLGQAPGPLVAMQAEQSLLGALLTKPDLLRAVPGGFSPDHYADPWHADIHRAVIELGQPGVPAALAVMQALAINDRDMRAYIPSLLTAAISFLPSAVRQYADLVTDMHRRRGIVALADDMRAGAFASIGDGTADSTIARALTGLDELTSRHAGGSPSVSMDDAMDAALARADEAAKRGGPAGLPTGFNAVDEMLGGLEDGTLTVLAGRPGMGKSGLGWQWAVHVASLGIGVLAVSLEMSAAELGRRALSSVSGVPVWTMKRGKHAQHAARLIAARKRLHGMPLTIEDGGGLTAAMIGLKARAAHRKHGLGLIMVDHLHIVRPDDQDSRNGATWAVGKVSGAMKRLAKEFGCPVLLLAQLNRGVEGRDDKRPGLGDLRQSGDIEQDADAVAFIYRAEYYMGKEPEKIPGENDEKFSTRLTQFRRLKDEVAGKADLIFAKVRDGAPGTVPLLFHGETTSFSEPEYGE